MKRALGLLLMDLLAVAALLDVGRASGLGRDGHGRD